MKIYQNPMTSTVNLLSTQVICAVSEPQSGTLHNPDTYGDGANAQ